MASFSATLYGGYADSLQRTLRLKDGQTATVPAELRVEYRNVEGRSKAFVTVVFEEAKRAKSAAEKAAEQKQTSEEAAKLREELAGFMVEA